VDEAERALLAERMLAEQEERRRLAELLHDGPVQQLSAIAQMLDTSLVDLASGDTARAAEIVARSLELTRDAARDVRALCDDLEPQILHRLGFAAAVAALTRRIASRHDVEIELDVSYGDELGENAAVALYELLREATEQTVRRGTLTRIEITLRPTDGGGVELVVIDDGPPERRAAVLESLAERASTLNGRFSSEVRYPRGSTLRIDVPPAAAHR
jgi:two-component system NarL family sensor kinase